jgi:hypothetical protein
MNLIRGEHRYEAEWRADGAGRARSNASRVRARRQGLVECESGGGVAQAESVAEAESCVSEVQVVSDYLSGASYAQPLGARAGVKAGLALTRL